MNFMRRINVYIIALLFIFAVSTAYGAAYESANYSLIFPKIVIAGGEANSLNYTIDNVEIGKILSGKAGSANYSLDAICETAEEMPPNPPVVDPVKNPTNNPMLVLSGTKDTATSIYINGYEAVPLNNNTTWSYNVTLSEGANNFIITARNASGMESESAIALATLDTVPPFVIIDYPLAVAIVSTSPIAVQGTSDGGFFSEERNLNFGFNSFLIEKSDTAGNISSKAVEVYLIREPIAPPAL